VKDLTIIIVNINNKKLLQQCLDAICKNTHKISFDIIVIDNASTDGSQAMVKQYFPQILLIENKKNAGFTKASNQGLKQYRSRYALLLNDDTIVKDPALDKMVEFMDQNPDAGACGAKLLNTDGTIQRQGGLFGQRFWQSQKPVAVDFVIGAALMARKEVIDKVGIMDENLFFYNDDLDWCARIRRAGYKVYFLPQAEIIHYGGYSSKRKFNPRLFVEGFTGGLYFCRKFYGELAYHIYRFALALVLCIILPFFIFSPNKFGAYLAIILISLNGQIPKPVLK
jgi:GT2 family glycosyltransferase